MVTGTSTNGLVKAGPNLPETLPEINRTLTKGGGLMCMFCKKDGWSFCFRQIYQKDELVKAGAIEVPSWAALEINRLQTEGLRYWFARITEPNPHGLSGYFLTNTHTA
jgi:hypothetical protein